jgi:cyclopropane-fatty-acyl-phospholipid synthase
MSVAQRPEAAPLEARHRFAPEQQLYQSYSTSEDRERTNRHYDLPAAFFTGLTGGEWNCYSSNLWTGASTATESQEAKFELFAELMALRPGQRILDVGCGWGGSLVYLCQRYGVVGVGLTLSAQQRQTAQARAASHIVDAHFVECHWQEYADSKPFDAVYTDEVVVHLHDLGAFFSRVYGWLREGGRMVNKELHLTHRRFADMTRAMSFINEIFGSTGNYRTMAEELALVEQAGFEVQRVVQIPIVEYQKTLDSWLANVRGRRAEMEALVPAETVRRFRTYLALSRRILGLSRMTLDVVSCQKTAPPG